MVRPTRRRESTRVVRAGLDGAPTCGLSPRQPCACYVISSALELNEAIARHLARFEVWQADEVPLSVTFLACGLAWYAWRRRREIQAQLALHERAERRISDLLARNRELSQQLISRQESDRLELARELHDELGQICTAIRIEIACLRGCRADDRDGILAAAERADSAASGLYGSVRAMLHRLRPADLDSLGLEAALQALCGAWTERTGIVCTLDVEGVARAMGDSVDMTIYRVAQEALTNVARHAAASKVQVTLSCLVDGAGEPDDPRRWPRHRHLRGDVRTRFARRDRTRCGRRRPAAGAEHASGWHDARPAHTAAGEAVARAR